MRTYHRPYSDAAGDFNRIADFITRHYAHIRTHSTWCIGRFADWRYALYDNKVAGADFWSNNAELWLDGFDRLAGISLSENGDTGFTILTTAGCRFLYSELLDWVLARWSGRGPVLSTELTERQETEAAALVRAGFGDAFTFLTQRYDLTRDLAVGAALEPGFVIVDMASRPDYVRQRLLRADAFRDKREYTEAELQRELEFDAHSRTSPVYHAPTDLCVVAPDGRFASGCEALIDTFNLEADIERVCTHSAFRRRGLARAVSLECLRRLKDMGLRAAYITGYSPEAIALYRSLGPASESASHILERGTPAE